MTVPASGSELSWGKIAQERLGGSYIAYSSASRGANVPVYNIFKAGNTGGGATAGSTYPALATASPGYDIINQRATAGTLFSASMWYSYNQDAVAGYTMKRKVKTSDSTGTVTGDSVDNTMTLSGGSPTFLSYSYLTTFGTAPPFTTTSNIPTTNKYTTFSSLGFSISPANPDLPQGDFGVFGDWGMDSVSKNSPSSPSPALNPGPTAGGFGSDISVLDYQIYSSRGTPGYQVKANLSAPENAMSYTITSGDTVFFDYEQEIFVN
tara:strand:- start:250 stop:1044 length:795 start_codon:yes stop_codon:yes gene_type:complete